MKRPKRYSSWDLIDGELVYKLKDIEPLLNELVRLKADEKPFPSYQDFERDCMLSTKTDWNRHIMYNYFSQFCYETKVFPKVGDMVEGEDNEGDTFSGILKWYELDNGHVICNNIRPVSTPTREDVIKSINNKLENGTDTITFDRELVEQFLNILKGQDNDF